MCPASVGTSRARALETGEAKLWALLVGVNQYADQRLPALSYSALDCQGLGEAIAAATRTFPQTAVTMHHDFAVQTDKQTAGQDRAGRLLPDQVAISGRLGLGTIAKLRGFPAAPPKQSLVQASLQQIVQTAKPQDTVLFYFSGHGVLDPETHQAFLCLTDTDRDDLTRTGLGVQTVLNLLNQCQAHQQIVWLDACHSGGMTLRAAGQSTRAFSNPTPQLLEVLQQQAARSQGFYALLSCDQNQLSWEFPELGHGVFTYYLMRGLLGEAADAQGVIEADALYKYVYYQTLRYIDKTNQQLRLINQQKRGRGEIQLQPEYPLQTPKRIVEGIGELIIGAKPELANLRYPRQALVIEGLSSSPIPLAISKILRSEGSFELTYFPQPGKEWATVRTAIQTCLQSEEGGMAATDITHSATVLLYLRGRIQVSETGDACLVLRNQVEVSRSWLRQELRRSPVARQVVILDCPGAEALENWVEDLQTGSGQGQCLVAVAAPDQDPDWFAQTLLDTLNNAEPQTGLPIAGWIAQIQARSAEAGITPHLWLSGTQGVIEVLPGKMGMRGNPVEEFDLGICPYLGLRAFSEDDAAFFFGRETLVQQLVQGLMQRSFLAVVGASGSGKSSVVQAGLMAQLRQGKQIPGSESWWIESFRPGARPLTALAQRLAASEPEQLQLEGILYQGIESFVYWLRSRPEPMIVLVVDQFEELFTLAPAEDRQRFLALTLNALEHAGDRFKFVVTLRSDFIASSLEYPVLAKALQQSSLLVPPALNQDSYRQVILRPAEKVGLQVEPELVEVLLQELSHTTADLPLLEFVLEQLWEHRRPGELTLQVYQQQIGGLKGALERKAQSLYDSLDPEAQACARWIFLSLTQLGEGTEDTRRRIAKSDLVVKKYPVELVERTLQSLVAAKLVVVGAMGETTSAEVPSPEAARSRSESSPSPSCPSPRSSSSILAPVTVEVAHEILIRHWSTLRWWLEENRSRLRAQRQIEQAATQWWQGGQQPDFLLRGVRLDAAEELYVQYTDELSQEVQQFIEAGLAEREREQRQTRQRLRRAQAAVVLISCLGVAATGFGGFAYLQRQKALLNEIATLNTLSESQFLANRQLEALTTSLRAGQQLQQMGWWGVDRQTATEVKTQTIATLQQAIEQTQEQNRLEGHSEQVNSVTISPDGQWIASGSDDNTVRLWKNNGSLERRLAATDRVTAVSFSPDGQSIAAASADGTVTLWSLTGAVRQTLQTGNWVTSLALGRNGEWLAVSSRDRTVQLWNVATGQQLKTFAGHSGFVNSVAFSASDQLLASASEDGTIRLWNSRSGNLIRTLTGHQGRVTSVVFSPHQNLLASAGEDKTLRLWNVSNGTAPALATSALKATVLEGHLDAVKQVRFSPDGQRLISASMDNTLRLWQTDGTLITTFRGHGDAVLSVDVSPDGKSIVSGSADKTMRLWNVSTLSETAEDMTVVSVSPDGQMLATTGWDGKIQLWNREGRTKKLITSWQAHSQPISTLSFSPDGRQVASGSDDQTLKLWTIDGNLQFTLNGHSARVTGVAYSPDGQWLASASEDKTVRLWRTSNGNLIRALKGHQDGVSSVAWSSDNVLASGSYDNTVKVWRADGLLLHTLEGHDLAIAAVTFSPDEQTLASASWDNTIKLWNVKNGTLLHTLTGHQGGVTSLAFNADGTLLTSGSADQTIKLWNPLDGHLNKSLVGLSGEVASLRFSPDQQTLISNSGSSLQIWNLNLTDLLQQGCARIQDYLETNPNVTAAAQSTCR